MKWRQLCRVPELRDGIIPIVLELTKTQKEAYELVNIYLLHHFESAPHTPLPELNQTFMYQCCAVQAESWDHITSNPKHTLFFQQAVRIQREKNGSFPDLDLRPIQGLCKSINDLARQMMTACQNHLIVNFYSRLTRWLRVRWTWNSEEAYECINGTFELSEEEKTPLQKKLFKCLQYPLTESNLRTHFNHFLYASYRILKHVNAFPSGTRGVRTFSLMPLKSSSIASHIQLDNTTLGLILKKSLPQRTTLSLSDGSSYTPSSTLITNDEIWWHFFRLDEYAPLPKPKQFAHVITTNGYWASVHLEKEKPPLPEGGGGPGLLFLRKKRKTEKKQDQPPLDPSMFTRLVGCDPGVTNLFTAVDDTGKIIQASTRQYRHLAKMNEARKWELGLRKRYASTYGTWIQNPGSFKTASLSTFTSNMPSFAVRDERFQFMAQHGFLKWRFKTSLYAKKALAKLARKIGKTKKTCVGLGDWSRRDGFGRGHPSGPVLAFKKELARHVTVVEVDEYCTSKKCSHCFRDLKKVEFPFSETRGQRQKRVQTTPLVTFADLQTKNQNKTFPCHAILRCDPNECGKVWHRDVNGGINILQITHTIVHGNPRPEHLRRQARPGMR